jgi:hypothetical protein
VGPESLSTKAFVLVILGIFLLFRIIYRIEIHTDFAIELYGYT